MFPSVNVTGQLKNRLPSIYAGLGLMLTVFAILTGQVGLYFLKRPIRSRHSAWIRAIVILIWAIQALQAAASCHMTVVAHNDDSLLPMDLVYQSTLEWAIYIVTSVATECLVHAFFISRIYLLEPIAVPVRVSLLLCIILILEASFGIVSLLFVLMATAQRSRQISTWAFPVWLGISILIDILIAGSLCFILQKNKSYLSPRTNWLIRSLTKFCIQTGLITSLATGATVAIWVIIQLDPGHLIMCCPMGGIYATCFMANLLARESYFYHRVTEENGEYPDVAMESIVFASNRERESATFTID